VNNAPIVLVSSGSPQFKVPSYQNWNLSVEQKVVGDTTMSVAYVGSKGVHLLGETDINQPTVAARLGNAAANVNSLRPFAGYSAIRARIPKFDSSYHSLQVTVNRRFTRGLSGGIAYTWSKLLTDASVDRDIMFPNSYDLRANRGLSNINTPQIFVANYVYELPFYKSQRGLSGRILGGWEFSGITSVQSGQSLAVVQYVDPFNAAGSGGLGMNATFNTQIWADRIGDPKGPHAAPGTFFNTGAFADAVGHFGTVRPGVITGPGLQKWDITLMKNTRITERVNLQLRLETFNTFNHTNPASVDVNVDDGAGLFGTVTGYHDARRVQLGAKLYF
jgi:hypothetical protein